MFPPGSAGSTERRLREVRVQGSVFHHEQLDAIVAILRALKDTDVEVLFLLWLISRRLKIFFENFLEEKNILYSLALLNKNCLIFSIF